MNIIFFGNYKKFYNKTILKNEKISDPDGNFWD